MSGVQNQAYMTHKAIKNVLPSCKIDWNTLSEADWEAYFCRIKRSNLLQSLPYARAMAGLNQQRIRMGLIKINEEEAGLIMILEAGILNNAVHAVLVDRGPLWFDGYGMPDHFESFLQTFAREFPKRFGRRIRFLPEVEKTPSFEKIIKDNGFVPVSQKGYQTIWLDLRQDVEDLRSGLNKKWRNTLSKAESNQLDIQWNEQEYFDWLLQHYTIDKSLRGYDGPLPKTVKALAREFSRGQNMMIAAALLDGKPIAAILLLIHGSCATYQIGYTTETGRQKCAHHALLWNAMTALKERKIYDFDLGGINMEDAKGVALFKQGLGGVYFESASLYH